MSAEFEGDIDDQIRIASNSVEDEINKKIESKSYDIALKSWDCIIILMKDDPNFDEVIKYSRKKQDMDFRLKVDYDDFLEASALEQQSLIFNMLNRSLDLLIKKGLPENKVNELRGDVLEIAKINRWV